MELEEKAAVAGAGKLKADEELAEVCTIQSITNNSGPLLFSLCLSFILPQQLRICRRTGSKLAKALKEKEAVNKELQTANETIKQYKQQVAGQYQLTHP